MEKLNKDNVYRADDTSDAALQQEIDAALGDMNLEDLVDIEQGKKPTSRTVGKDKLITGTVVSIQGDDIFVDVGGRSEAVLPASQFDAETPLPAEGDTVEVTIEGFDRDGMLKLSRQGAVQAAAWDTLERGQVLEGVVTGLNKGGLELKLAGSIRAFMPISQIDTSRIEQEHLDGFLNQKLQAVVTEVDHREGNVVLSRRTLLKQQAKEQAKLTWESLQEGQVLSGKVRSIMPYGVFVDIGGIDGLVHIRDMAHSRVEKPEDLVHTGQTVEVKVLTIDREKEKIGLGLKQTQADPWEQAEAKWAQGTTLSVRVVKLMEFGAFAEVEPGIEGLIPVSEISFRRIGHPKEELAVGDVVKVNVLRVDEGAKRMSLSIKQAGDDPWIGAEARWPAESTIEGTVTRITEFGAFVELAAGVEGLIHISQISDKRISSVKGFLDVGKAVTARVIEVDEDRRRISLTMRKEIEKSDQQMEGTMADLERFQAKTAETQSKKPLKGGLETGGVATKFGELNIG